MFTTVRFPLGTPSVVNMDPAAAASQEHLSDGIGES